MHKLQTYYFQMRICLDEIVNMRCIVATTVHGESNFVDFCTHKEIIVHNVDVVLCFNSCSWTAYLISVFKKLWSLHVRINLDSSCVRRKLIYDTQRTHYAWVAQHMHSIIMSVLTLTWLTRCPFTFSGLRSVCIFAALCPTFSNQ